MDTSMCNKGRQLWKRILSADLKMAVILVEGEKWDWREVKKEFQLIAFIS